MKKIIALLVAFVSFSVTAQDLNRSEEIISLAKIYRSNHSLASLDDNSSKLFEKYNGTEFETVAKFIQEATKKPNRIIESEFLSRPDSLSLKLFHTMIMVNYNMYESDPMPNKKVVAKYLKKDISTAEQLKQYYSSLFVSVTNKNRPFDYSDLNWDLAELGLTNDREQSVFFLVFIDKLTSQISSYHGAMSGPNWDGIEKYVQILPTINGKKYFQFDTFYIEDFKMSIYKKNRYFKEYYMPKFYDVLVGHILMMEEKQFERSEITEFLLTSILSRKQYYKHCNRMDVVNAYLKEK